MIFCFLYISDVSNRHHMPQVFHKLLLAIAIPYCQSLLAFQGLHKQELRKHDGEVGWGGIILCNYSEDV